MAGKSSDLGLLLLLLREATPLQACSLPLLPAGIDRGRRAEDVLQRMILNAAAAPLYRIRHERGGACGTSGSKGESGSDRGDLEHVHKFDGISYLVYGVLCTNPRASPEGRHCHVEKWGQWASSGGGGGGSGTVDFSDVRVGSSGVTSERASQLLDVALRWMEKSGDSTRSLRCEPITRRKKSGVFEGSGVEHHAACTLAPALVLPVFDAVVEARPQVLQALLGGVLDQSRAGAASAQAFLQTWEALMVQEARWEVRI